MAQNKEKKPRDIIIRLERRGTDNTPENDNNPRSYTSRTEEMAEVARRYHENLQKEGLVQDKEQCRIEIENVLSKIKVKIPQMQKAKLARRLIYNEISNVLEMQPNSKVPGSDSILAELYKILNNGSKVRKKKGEVGFDITQILRLVIEDIKKME